MCVLVSMTRLDECRARAPEWLRDAEAVPLCAALIAAMRPASQPPPTSGVEKLIVLPTSTHSKCLSTPTDATHLHLFFLPLSVFVRCTHTHTHTHTHTRRTGSRQASSPWHPPRRVPTVFPRPSRATGLLARPARAPVGRPRSTRACFRESRQTPLCQIGLIRTN